MSVMSARRGRRPQYTEADVAELRRLARWYEAIADDYGAATGTTSDRAKLAELCQHARAARRWAAQLRAKVADR